MKKNNKLVTTCYIAVENAIGDIQLHDLYMEDLSHHKQPCLSFKNAKFEGTWDNSIYVLKFFRGIKKNKKKYLKQLKEFCKNNDLNYQETLIDLLDIYKDSKKLNFFK